MMDKKIFRFYLPAILWSAFIFFLCFIPGSTLPHEDWLDKIYFDKIVHVFLYLIFFLLIMNARKEGGVTIVHFISAGFICLAQGILIEYIQESSLIRGRSFDVRDIVANAVGVVAGIITAYAKHKTN